MLDKSNTHEFITRKTLIDRVKNNPDEQSWADFCDVYDRYIYTILRNMGVFPSEADDLRQDVMIKLWKGLPTYDETHGHRFRSWLSTVIVNCVRDDIRKRKCRAAGMNEVQAITELERLDSIRISDVDKLAEDVWRVHITTRALERIETVVSKNAIRIFRLSLDGLSSNEIAKQLNVKLTTVYHLRAIVKKRLIEEIAYLQEIWS